MDRRSGILVFVAAVALLATVPMVYPDPYTLGFLILIFLKIVWGESWNLMGGYGGQRSLGHAAFYGIGAYTATILFMRADVFPLWGALLGGGLAGLVALGTGLICFRLRGPYFSLSTIAIAEIMRLIAVNWKSMTNGSQGILISKDFEVFGHVIKSINKIPYYYVFLALAVISVALVYRIERSRLGYYLNAIREDQEVAESLGIHSARIKTIAFCLSAFMVGVAGGFYAFYSSYISPDGTLHIEFSVEMVLICIIGGMGRLWGPVLGVVVLQSISEALRTWIAGANLLVYGIFVVLVILFMPEGIMGGLQRMLRWRMRETSFSK